MKIAVRHLSIILVAAVCTLASARAQPMGGEANVDTEREVERPIPVRPVVRTLINETTPERDRVGILIAALNADNPNVDGEEAKIVVELCNVDLDLTGVPTITIGRNRSLIASPACARGPHNLGPRLRVKKRLHADGPMFAIRSGVVLFSGFRLEGPNPGIWAAIKT